MVHNHISIYSAIFADMKWRITHTKCIFTASAATSFCLKMSKSCSSSVHHYPQTCVRRIMLGPYMLNFWPMHSTYACGLAQMYWILAVLTGVPGSVLATLLFQCYWLSVLGYVCVFVWESYLKSSVWLVMVVTLWSCTVTWWGKAYTPSLTP